MTEFDPRDLRECRVLQPVDAPHDYAYFSRDKLRSLHEDDPEYVRAADGWVEEHGFLFADKTIYLVKLEHDPEGPLPT